MELGTCFQVYQSNWNQSFDGKFLIALGCEFCETVEFECEDLFCLGWLNVQSKSS